MIAAFEIEGFKCFARQRLELAPMTVLCGINGAGKSSFIQALLLAHLAARGAGHVALNGPFDLRLGQALDVLRLGSLRLSAESSQGKATWTLSAEADDALMLRVDETAPVESVPSELGVGLIYLQAERLGPRDLQEMSSAPSHEVNLGSKGEYVAQVLNLRGGRYPVRDELCHPGGAGPADAAPRILPKQVEAWLQDLVPGIELLVEPFPALSACAVRLRRPGQATEWLRPQNIGFGVSYALPVILAGLVAQPGSMIIVENPEAHLPPPRAVGARALLGARRDVGCSGGDRNAQRSFPERPSARDGRGRAVQHQGSRDPVLLVPGRGREGATHPRH